jgi:hypothetical protein
MALAATTLLAQKLRAEISYEAEVQQDDVQVGAVPQDLVEFLQEGGWEVRCVLRPLHVLMGRQIKDTPANDEVFLTRRFGDERYVAPSFHLSLLITSTASASCSPSQTCNLSPTRTSLRARTTRAPRAGTSRRCVCRSRLPRCVCVYAPPTPSIAFHFHRDKYADVYALQSTHPGALHADLYCADGVFDVANVAYYKDARVATELSIASDWERRTLWTGPLVSAPPLNSASFCPSISFPPKFFTLQSSSVPP